MPGVEPLDEEPSAARVLMMDERTGELVTPEGKDANFVRQELRAFNKQEPGPGCIKRP